MENKVVAVRILTEGHKAHRRLFGMIVKLYAHCLARGQRCVEVRDVKEYAAARVKIARFLRLIHPERFSARERPLRNRTRNVHGRVKTEQVVIERRGGAEVFG